MDSTATNYKISWFRKEREEKSLDLSPNFQRRPVWSDEQASYLIDTILSGLPVPEVYIRSESSAEGKTTYEVVDGQQRIRAILKFGANDLELSGDDVAAKWQSKRFDDLKEKEQKAFWDYKLVVRELGAASDVEIRNLFKRLNINSVVLNDQELRHAEYSGHFIKSMEELADDEWWLESHVVTVRQIRRMEDVEYVSELFIGLLAGPQDKKKSLDDYYQDYEKEMPEKAEWVAQFQATLDFIRKTLPPEDIRKWSGKSDFYTLFLAMGNLANSKLNAKQRESLVAELRKFRVAVDQGKKRDADEIKPKDVAQYVEAVTRAATDKARREIRLQVLEKRLSEAIGKSSSRKAA
jgi:hypothetical protein